MEDRRVLLVCLALLLLTSSSSSSSSQVLSSTVGDVRLTGGEGSHQGNIQVNVGGTWMFICDDNFSFPEADAVCRDLGYNLAQTFTRNNRFGHKTLERRQGSVKMLGVNCTGISSFSQCSFTTLPHQHCGHTEVSGVECRVEGSRCSPGQYPCGGGGGGGGTCVDRTDVCDGTKHCPDNSDEADWLCGDVGVTKVKSNTAINIPGALAGLVYVKHQGQWGSVCDNFIFPDDAKVICRSLGFTPEWSVALPQNYLGRGSGKIWVERPGCSGQESWVGQCPNNNFTDYTKHCHNHDQDASVFCYDGGVEVRVSDGLPRGSGRVEVKLGGQWGSVCGDRFDDLDAKVVCRMLGYHGDARAIQPERGSVSGPAWQLLLDCMGHEDNLQQCRVRLTNDTCLLSNAAAVTCSHNLRSSGTVSGSVRSLQPSDCGVVEDASTRFLTRLAKVRGGSSPSRFDAPWLVGIEREGRVNGHICGGTIISEYYVLTATHCFRKLGRLNVVVRVGDYSHKYREVDEQVFHIDKMYEHEEFERLSYLDHDITLLKLQPNDGQGIRFGPRVKALCLPNLEDRYEDLEDCTIIGWGPIIKSNRLEDRPREGQVNIIEDRFCEQLFLGGPKNFTSSFVCIGNLNKLVNICQGDSGGPMACRLKGEQGPKKLYGIASSGLSCTARWFPDSMTRVTKYLSWIYDKISHE